ncbi:MAG: alkaline phosphatase, partial [Bacteroidales bacterium]|nr:alkaline phosphatase [Bacteroidales bacterium]
IKTNNGMISVTPDSVKAETILEIAEKNGLSTGMVVTCGITHATPAVFVAHQINRNNHEEIAYDLYKSGIDLFIGGGRKYFEKRSDKMNLLDSLKNNGYNILTNIDDIKKTNSAKIAGLIEYNDPPMALKRDNLLPNATEVAIKILNQSENGFFLMVEGSQIDWAAHDNDEKYLLAELIDFDAAVGKALDFAEKDGNTLVIITADHETGGLAIFDGNVETGEIDIKFSSDEHTGVWVPVFTFGLYAENFTGFYENTQIFDKMMDAFGFENE